jgi:hypothetical protein
MPVLARLTFTAKLCLAAAACTVLSLAATGTVVGIQSAR